MLVVALLATMLALHWRADIFSRILFAWAAMRSGFVPILLMRLAGRQGAATAALAAMLAGFELTVLLTLLPKMPGNVAERVLTFVIALL